MPYEPFTLSWFGSPAKPGTSTGMELESTTGRKEEDAPLDCFLDVVTGTVELPFAVVVDSVASPWGLSNA